MIRHAWMAAALCLFAGPALAETYTATLAPSQEVPPTASEGSGTATVTLDGNNVTYEVTYKGLTGPATMGHIHGPADPGQNAGVLVPFKDVSASPIKGTATLTPEQVTALKAGKEYVNVHTDKNKGGEIRGQLKPSS